MNRITNSFGILLAAAVMLLVGIASMAVRVAEDTSTVSEYNSYIESARNRAQKGIFYYAKQDYLKAFSIYADDQELFREFLNFLEASEDASYRTYLKTYLKKYPQDVEAYEKLCEMYFSEQNYKEVQNLLLSASEVGVKSEGLAAYWDEVLYKYTLLAGGYSEASGFYGRQAIVERNGKKGIYYLGSGMALETIYDDLSFCVNGVIAVQDGDDCYFADSAGNKCGVLDKKVDNLSILSNGFSAVSIDSSYGFVSEQLEVPDALPYEYASAFSNGIAAVKMGGKWGFVNASGEFVVSPVYDDVKLTEFDTAVSAGVVFVKEGDVWRMVDTEGNELSGQAFEEVNTFLMAGEPTAVKLDGRWTFVKNTGELYEVSADFYAAKSFNNGLAPVTLDGKSWGYMDAQGKIVIEPQFDDCRQFSEYGAAAVKKGEIWSFIQLLMYRE